MLKKIMLVFAIIICLFILTGCRKQIDFGTVADKSFTPAHKVYSPMIMCVNKKTRIIPRWINHSDKWSILVQNDDGSEWWDVTEEFFNSVEIGDSVDRRNDSS